MPVLRIRALPQKDSTKITPALKKVAKVISDVYGCPERNVWATWEEIKPGFYVEGQNEAFEQKMETHAPICELTCFEGKSPKELEELLEKAASSLGESLGIGSNVFITLNQVKSGQVIAGNGVIRH